MINSILNKYKGGNFEGKESEPVNESHNQVPQNIHPEILDREMKAKEIFIKRAKARLLGKAICKSEGCQNLRANGSSRCQDCSLKNKEGHE